MKHEYVISVKISTDQPISFKSIPEITEREIINGSVEILAAETYESWKQDQEKL